MKKRLKISNLPHIWIFDLDGTILEHNRYKYSTDKFLPGTKEFLQSIPSQDYILILTGREMSAKSKTEEFLTSNGIRFDTILYEMPIGERLLFNDKKPSGLECSFAFSVERNVGFEQLEIFIDKNL